MNISGIRPISGFYDYNSINTRAVESSPVVADEKVTSGAQAVVDKPVESVSKVSDEDINKAKAKQTFGAYDYASQYKPNQTYSMKGADSDIKSLDVEKAVNDMQKDSVLHQYQYFVGDTNGDVAASTASIRGAENFTL